MQYLNDIDIFGMKHAGVLELDLGGWLSANTVAEFNLAVKCFNHNLRGVVLDYREAVITLKPDDIHLFERVLDCPLVYLGLPEHAEFSRRLVAQRRNLGFSRALAYDKVEADLWLSAAMRRRK